MLAPFRRRYVGIATLAMLAACGANAVQPSTRPLNIAIDLWAGYYPLILADELGLLEKAGVRVQIEIPRNTDRMLAAFAASEHDAVAVSLADVVTLTRVAPDLRLVLLSDESAGGDMVVGRKPVTCAADLRGKRIGTNLGGFGEIFVRAFLERYDLSPADVQMVGIEAATASTWMTKGEVDFVHTWDPYASQLIAKGGVKVFTSRDTPGLILDGLIFRGAVLAERHDEIQRLTRAWFEASAWWRDHREEGARRIEKRLGLAAGEAMPQGIKLLSEADNHRLMGDGGASAPLHAVAKAYVEFFVGRGLLTRRPTRLFDNSCLP